ncbi:beta-ketoacyl-[acyl-carrier-protein] synthase family protein [Pseudoalteromonas sp. OOF1S-7]|uniref:beta-ketoacyl-[acyl-carrier-protein] synthase family protein n=1 Tax=Pseudoalteromonas sp. OOF1S-7 TaxID=2917757 RepID=UPI001EF4B883|nr:beta-ketoacyl-[acyl-carrier-protein] synthase family protein [Pseudoalteromonas sp. OOF1S-7]MCG7536694.1 beta-ketoacyl-[acyl-carrier-protein] synthase family protein [Pseudoalteromonas sp. OOF1S-7]
MSVNRVVITGLGVVSSVGTSINEFKHALLAGESGAGPASQFNTQGYEDVVNCEVKDFSAQNYIKHIPLSELGRTSQFSIAAAKMALDDAGFSVEQLSGRRIPVCIGTTDGESQSLDKIAKDWVEASQAGHDEAFNIDLVEQSVSANLANSISREYGLTGESVTISTACAAGNYAIGHAFDKIRSGQAEAAICGGSDSVCRKTYAGFFRLGTIAPEKCQPFDKNRKGILTGEGSGILILESLSSARKRGAKIYAEVLGYGLNCDANHMVSPNKESIAACIRRAHKNAGIKPEQVDYICAHGTGTVANDETESGAIKLVYGEVPPPVSSIKSMLGHSMGAASAIASIACVLAIKEQFLPPTINHQTADENCPVDCIPNQSRKSEVNIVQNNGFAFGGNNAITLYGAFHE